MTYVTGAIAGVLLGGLIGYLKSIFIWKKYLERAAGETHRNDAGIYTRAIISNAVNLVTLVAVILLRNLTPFDGLAFLIGTALSLAAVGQIMALGQKRAAERAQKEACTR